MSAITVVLVLVKRQLLRILRRVVIIRPVSMICSTKHIKGVPYTHYTQEDYHELWIRRNDKVEDPSRPWVVEKNGEYKYYGNFDWYNCLFDNTRPTWEHNLTVSGGTEKVKYMLSGNYYNQKGIIRIDPDRFKKYTFRSKDHCQYYFLV